MARKLQTLSMVIRRRFQRRIVLTLAILIALACVFSGVEIWLNISTLKERATARAEDLQNLVISEALVNNQNGAYALIDSENLRNKDWKTTWLELDFNRENQKLLVDLDFHWTYVFPLRTVGERKFGSFLLEGNLLSQPEISFLLLSKLWLLLAACVGIAFAIYPLATKIPNELILKPVRDLLIAIEDEETSAKHSDTAPYAEIAKIRDDLKSILTERKRLLDQQIELQRGAAVTQTAQMIAHDMRRPFTLVKSIMQNLRMSSEGNMKEIVEESYPKINRSIEQVDAMLTELVSLGKGSGLKISNFLLSEFLESCIDESASIFSKSPATIEKDFKYKDVVQADKTKLYRVFSNILTNAFQAVGNTPAKIWIKSRLTQMNGKSFVEFRIGNSDSFISKEQRDRIFKIFYTSGKTNGSGLGLAVSQGIVRSHGGNIWCESSKELGTEFIFTLPHSLEKNFDFTETSSEVNFRKNLTFPKSVLIVDDEEIWLHLTEKVLLSVCETKVEIRKAKSYGEACESLSFFSPDLIISDVDLGKTSESGLQLLRALRERGVKSYIHIHSTSFFSPDKREVLEMGANSFASKPFGAATAKEIFSKLIIAP